jgi:hypothetical protein
MQVSNEVAIVMKGFSFAILNSKALFWTGLVLAVLLAGAVAIHSGNTLRYGDEQQYHNLAVSVMHGHGFVNVDGSPTAFRPPGYPFVLMTIYTITEQPIAAKILNVLLLGALILSLGAIATRIKPAAINLVPYLVLACPILIYVTSVLYPQILGSVMLAIVVLILTRKNVSLKDFGIAGVIYGLLCLAIPSFLMVLPLFGLYLLINHWPLTKASLTQLVQQGCILIVAILVVLAPWTIRNYVTFGQLVPISSITGLNLMFGNSALTTPNSGVNLDIWSQCPAAAPDVMEEVVRDNHLKDCAIRWIKENPADAAKLYVGKVINYFNYRNEVATQSEVASWRDWLSFSTYYPLLVAAVIRLTMVRRLPLIAEERLIYLLYFGNAFISAVFFTRVRFRIPFDALLIPVVAAFAFDALIRMNRWWENRCPHYSTKAESNRI